MSRQTKVFILGRPGSGKSTAAKFLQCYFKQQGRSTFHINDYTILQHMFREDVEHKLFRPTANNGFDALYPFVLDNALKKVEEQVEEHLSDTDIVTIEFARDDYSHALRQFNPDFVENAYVLFMNADLELCLQRVHSRVKYSATNDDHPSFSDEIFRAYYQNDNLFYIQDILPQEFAIHKPAIVLNNSGKLEDCQRSVEKLAQTILQWEESQEELQAEQHYVSTLKI